MNGKKNMEFIMTVRFHDCQDMVEIAEKLRFLGYDVSVSGLIQTTEKEDETDERN